MTKEADNAQTITHAFLHGYDTFHKYHGKPALLGRYGHDGTNDVAIFGYLDNMTRQIICSTLRPFQDFVGFEKISEEDNLNDKLDTNIEALDLDIEWPDHIMGQYLARIVLRREY